MPFVPTEKQIDSLNFLLKQLAREKIEIRLIRFENWSGKDVKGNEMEIVCLEDKDRYIIYYNGTVEQKYKDK